MMQERLPEKDRKQKNIMKRQEGAGRGHKEAKGGRKTQHEPAVLTGGSGEEQRSDKKAGKKSACPYSKKCGGCTMINTPMELQLRQKQ